MISVKDAEGIPYEAIKHSGVYGIKKITEDQSKRITVSYSYFQPNIWRKRSDNEDGRD